MVSHKQSIIILDKIPTFDGGNFFMERPRSWARNPKVCRRQTEPRGIVGLSAEG